MKRLCALGVLAALCGGVCPEVAEAANFVNNGALEIRGADGVPEGWQIAGATLGVGADGERRLGGQAALAVTTDGRAGVKLWQEVEAPPDTLLYFSAWVQANDRVVVRADSQPMAYTDIGEPQKLVGLVRSTADSPRVRIEFELGGWRHAGETVFRLGDVVLRPADPGRLAPRKTFGTTALALDGRAAAVIVYPSGEPGYRELAERIRQSVADRCGTVLETVPDSEAVRERHPVLRPSFRESNLVLLGRLGNNRALWPAYNRFLCAADDAYPGGSGYELRTAANVMRNGRNHLIVGGTTREGVQRAVERLVERIAGTPGGSGELVLPWILEVEMEGPVREAFEADDALWRADPFDRALPPVEPGYGSVRRWYQNAMAYYWTGWPGYRQRALDLLEPVLDDHAYTHHYIAEFFVRIYDMIDDGDLLSEAQRNALDDLIRKNFWEDLTGADIIYTIPFAPPYETIKWSGRHPVSAWMAELTKADFLRDYMDLQGDLKELVDFRHKEKDLFFRHVAAHRWELSYPSGSLSSHSESTAVLFRYALQREFYEEFFDSGHAERALMLERLNHVSGRYVRPSGGMDHVFKLGILSSYDPESPRFAALLEKIPPVERDPQQRFMGRYFDHVHRYTRRVPNPPPPDALDALTGVRLPEMTPHNQRLLDALNTGRSPVEVLDVATFRGGFDPEDDFLVVSGLDLSGYPAGALIDFTSKGRFWLNSNPAPSPFDHNAVSILRTDAWQENGRAFPAAASRDWVADLHRGGGVSFTLSPYMDTGWQRRIVWIQPGLFVVRDRVTAQQAGAYHISVNWRPAHGGFGWDGSSWINNQSGGQLRITPLGSAFHRSGAGRHVASVRLDEGQKAVATTVLQAFRPGVESPWTASLGPAGELVLVPDDAGAESVVVLWNPAASDSGIRSDAAVLVAWPDRVRVLSVSRFDLAGQSVFRSDRPVSVAMDWEDEAMLVDAGLDRTPVQFTLFDGGGEARIVPLEPGLNKLRFEGGVHSDGWRSWRAGLLAGMPSPVPRTGVVDPAEAPLAPDRTAEWTTAWTYTGLQRPVRIRSVRSLGDNRVDLGATVRLCAIRASMRFGGPLPNDIRTALPTPEGTAPPPDSPAWRPLTIPPVWQPGVRTGNYGRADPDAEMRQVIRMDEAPLEARYVMADEAVGLGYYNADSREGLQDFQLEITDLEADGQPEILVKPRIWPLFHRNRQEPDAFAVLDADGRERFQYDAPIHLQVVRPLDLDGSGTKKIVVVRLDARILMFGPGGRIERELDMYAMHRKFNETVGRPNTRHPAGGYTMPYALGTWRPNAHGARKLVVSRYGSFSFLDAEGNFEGVLMSVLGGSYYVNPALLPVGVDFDGDGKEEQVCLGRDAAIHLSGEPVPTIREAHRHFYPQVYAAHYLREPESSGGSQVDGTPVHVYTLLPWGAESPRFLLIVRGDYLAIYDAMEKSWSFKWIPMTQITAATTLAAGPDSLSVLALTADGLLWQFDWKGRIDRLASFRSRFIGNGFDSLSGSPDGDGRALLAGSRGLHLFRALEDLAQVSATPCHDAAFLPDGRSLVVTREDGAVLRLDPRPPDGGEEPRK